MIYWVVVIILFWHCQESFYFDTTRSFPKSKPGVKIPHNILIPPSYNRWQSFVCISYLIDNIYYHNSIILMIYSVVVIIYFDTTKNYPNFARGSKYCTISPASKNRWQNFVCNSYLLHKIYHYINIISIIHILVIMPSFWQYPNSTRGQDIVQYFDPTTSNNWWQSFVCVSYLLDKINHYIDIILMIYWVVVIFLFWHCQESFYFDTTRNYPNDISTPL